MAQRDEQIYNIYTQMSMVRYSLPKAQKPYIVA